MLLSPWRHPKARGATRKNHSGMVLLCTTPQRNPTETTQTGTEIDRSRLKSTEIDRNGKESTGNIRRFLCFLCFLLLSVGPCQPGNPPDRHQPRSCGGPRTRHTQSAVGARARAEQTTPQGGIAPSDVASLHVSIQAGPVRGPDDDDDRG